MVYYPCHNSILHINYYLTINSTRFIRQSPKYHQAKSINWAPSWSWSYGSWIYNYPCNQCLSTLKLWVRTPFMARCVLDLTLCDTVCQWIATGRRFSPGTPVSSTNKTDRHDIPEILLKVALNTINQTKPTINWKHNIKTSKYRFRRGLCQATDETWKRIKILFTHGLRVWRRSYKLEFKKIKGQW